MDFERLPVLLDVDGVAAHLNISVRHVRRLVFERRIPYLKVGNLLRFDPAEVAVWVRGLAVCTAMSEPTPSAVRPPREQVLPVPVPVNQRDRINRRVERTLGAAAFARHRQLGRGGA